MLLVALAIALTAMFAVCAIWPPAWAPEGWRRMTRPVRHRVRRRYYRQIY